MEWESFDGCVSVNMYTQAAAPAATNQPSSYPTNLPGPSMQPSIAPTQPPATVELSCSQVNKDAICVFPLLVTQLFMSI